MTTQPPGKMAFMLGMAAQVRARETVDGYVETYMEGGDQFVAEPEVGPVV